MEGQWMGFVTVGRRWQFELLLFLAKSNTKHMDLASCRLSFHGTCAIISDSFFSFFSACPEE